MVLGDLDKCMQKNETRPPTNTTHQNKLKMDKRFKCKACHHKNPRGKHRQEKFRYPMQQVFLFWTNILYSVYWQSTSVALRETFLLNITSSFGNVAFSDNLCRAVKGAKRPLYDQITEAPCLM